MAKQIYLLALSLYLAVAATVFGVRYLRQRQDMIDEQGRLDAATVGLKVMELRGNVRCQSE